MLTIKKRYPFNKLYVMGALAFIAGYGGIMVLAHYLPQRYAATDNFASITSQTKQAEPETTAPATTESEGTQNTAPSDNTQVITTPQSSSTDTPTTTEPATTTEPETPIITLPEVPVIPDPTEEPGPTEEPPTLGDIIDDVLDPLLP